MRREARQRSRENFASSLWLGPSQPGTKPCDDGLACCRSAFALGEQLLDDAKIELAVDVERRLLGDDVVAHDLSRLRAELEDRPPPADDGQALTIEGFLVRLAVGGRDMRAPLGDV